MWQPTFQVQFHYLYLIQTQFGGLTVAKLQAIKDAIVLAIDRALLNDDCHQSIFIEIDSSQPHIIMREVFCAQSLGADNTCHLIEGNTLLKASGNISDVVMQFNAAAATAINNETLVENGRSYFIEAIDEELVVSNTMAMAALVLALISIILLCIILIVMRYSQQYQKRSELRSKEVVDVGRLGIVSGNYFDNYLQRYSLDSFVASDQSSDQLSTLQIDTLSDVVSNSTVSDLTPQSEGTAKISYNKRENEYEESDDSTGAILDGFSKLLCYTCCSHADSSSFDVETEYKENSIASGENMDDIEGVQV